jgi:virginiamycin B lyase
MLKVGYLLLVSSMFSVVGSASTINEYPLAVLGEIHGLAAGPDGKLWLGSTFDSKILKVSTGGVIESAYILSSGGDPERITSGPDGSLWFTETSANKIGRITTAGIVSEFSLPVSGSRPAAIIGVSSDNALWFIERGDHTGGNPGRIGRMTTAGVLRNEFIVSSEPHALALGSDGNVWFTDQTAVGRITLSGVVTEFPISPLSAPSGIAAGQDGNLWFAAADSPTTAVISKISAAGAPLGTYSFPLFGPADTLSLTMGDDGNLWAVENLGNRVARIGLDGAIKEFPVPPPANLAQQIVVGPDGNLWFTICCSPQPVIATFSTSSMPVTLQEFRVD